MSFNNCSICRTLKNYVLITERENYVLLLFQFSKQPIETLISV